MIDVCLKQVITVALTNFTQHLIGQILCFGSSQCGFEIFGLETDILTKLIGRFEGREVRIHSGGIVRWVVWSVNDPG